MGGGRLQCVRGVGCGWGAGGLRCLEGALQRGGKEGSWLQWCNDRGDRLWELASMSQRVGDDNFFIIGAMFSYSLKRCRFDTVKIIKIK